MSKWLDVGIDFEVYYDDEYSLKKLENAQYVMDERFEVMGVSIKLPGYPAQWITGDHDHIEGALEALPWHKIRLIAHNARFDGSILEWRFGFRPAAYLCTMVGSRPHFVPKTGSASLDAIGQHLKLKAKGDAVHAMKGKHRTDLTKSEMESYGEYCKTDTEIACGIAGVLVNILPEEEQELIDLTLKKYLRPRLRLDGHKLVARIKDMSIERTAMLERIESVYGVTKDQLSSADKFAAVLEARGVEVPLKNAQPSKRDPAGLRMIPAFAKNDPGMKELLIHPDEGVRDLCQAKLIVSSTQEQSRLKRLLDLHNVMDGYLPVPMVYYGAHTGRFSGDESINLQNLPRVERNKDGSIKRGHLRFAVTAQSGYSIVAADFSNIEARLVATLAQQWDLVKGFARGEDIYSSFASQIYGRPINKKDHPDERFVGKTCILGLGYGMGWKKFLAKILSEGMTMTEKEAKRVVYLYRETYPNIPSLWAHLDKLAERFLTNPTGLHVWSDMTFCHERIILPNGMPIQYPDIAKDPRKGLYFKSRKHLALDADAEFGYEDGKKIWGGAFLENICQALARIIATRAELRLARMGLPAVMQVHDELVFKIPTQLVEKAVPAIEFEMTRGVDFLPELPIAVEVKHGPTYGECK